MAIEWDRKLKKLFDEIDDRLEDKYGGRYNLHPNRPPRGETSNREMDGLFNVGADFTSGYGSKLGRGYVVQVRMSTLEHVPSEVRMKINEDVERLVEEKLPVSFPGRNLQLERDGNLMKIIGDFSLGDADTE
ncbi:MAG: hypothetical protein RQ801_15360 [Spirochaetaceae bacterium]|nr:hypothetical protein [Spirochaetaceae bacterium]